MYIKKKRDLKPDRSNIPKSLRLQIYQFLGPKAEHMVVPENAICWGYSDSCTTEVCLHIPALAMPRCSGAGL